MRASQVVFLYFVVLNAAVKNVTSLEEELSDSIFGEFPAEVHLHLLSRTLTLI